MNQIPRSQEPSGPARMRNGLRPTRVMSPAMVRSLIAVLILMGFVASQRVPNPWKTAVRKQVTSVVNQNLLWTGLATVWGANLLNYAEHTSWGSVATLWFGAPRGKAVAASTTPIAWSPAVVGARVAEGFGWHHHGSGYVFEPGVSLAAPVGSPVLAVSSGVVTAVLGSQGHQSLLLKVSATTDVRYLGLSHALVRPGQTVGVGRVLGHTAGKTLMVQVLVHGYPVNPMLAQYLGSRP